MTVRPPGTSARRLETFGPLRRVGKTERRPRLAAGVLPAAAMVGAFCF